MKKSNLTIVIIILIMLGNLNFSISNFYKINGISDPHDLIKVIPKSSGYWYLTETIEVDGNSEWNTLATTYEWCNGSGTWNDPYVIENVTVDGQNVIDIGISIMNTDVFFEINNCTFKNVNARGIFLYKSNNSVISNNFCYDIESGTGILVDQITNTTISGNIFNNNYWGINIRGENITVTQNHCNNIGDYGIRCDLSKSIDLINNTATIELYLTDSCLISENICKNSYDPSLQEGGIKISFLCWNNIIASNYILNNSVGIRFYEGVSVTVATNTIIGNLFSNNERNIYGQYYQYAKDVGNLKDRYLEPTVITDDDGGDFNWTQFSSFAWANGNGTFAEPYIIDNIKMDGGMHTTLTAALLIKDSTTPFIIRNSEFSYFHYSPNCAGIMLENVENGKLINNSIRYLDGDGIRLEYSNNNTIYKNYINDGRNGIYVLHDELEEFKNNITQNTVEYSVNGLYITNIGVNSYSYPIRDNLLQKNLNYGIIFNNCMFINISRNNVYSNAHGMYLYECIFTEITLNRIINNKGNGIILNESSYNHVHRNTLVNNNKCILEINCLANSIGNNTCANRSAIPGYNLVYFLFSVAFSIIVLIFIKKKRRF
ncbi:MAG: NosD domain-containing protein [Promethearchaeota archaeon]